MNSHVLKRLPPGCRCGFALIESPVIVAIMKTTRQPWLGVASRPFLLLLAVCLGLCSARGQTVYEPGKSYFGRSNYVEYIAGDMPLVISVPHGGTLRPPDIPDRTKGEFTTDACTEELARTVQQAFHDCFGHSPHIIICRLDRRKVDCNRDLAEGAGADANARRAWNEFQGFIELARSNVLASAGAGFYIDLHGQSHAVRRVELGYCLTHGQLTNADSVLNEPTYAADSTVRTLARRTHLPFSELMRGTNSLGALLAAKGYPAVPSPNMPSPGPGNSYFDGGYNVRRHGSLNGGAVDGAQMEVNYVGVRDTPTNRTGFSRALAQVFDAFFTSHYGLDLRTGAAFGSK
jgi:hypothetical protein